MRCPVCKAANPPDSQRCLSCGAELAPPGSPDTAEDQVLVLPAAAIAAGPSPAARRPDKDEVDIVQVFIP